MLIPCLHTRTLSCISILCRCPHCQHYAPKYKALAKEVMSAQPSIKFYAVSCVAHHALCKAQNIKSYPTLKYFREGSYEKRNTTTRGINNSANSIMSELGFDEGVVTTTSGGGSDHNNNNNNNKEIARVVPFRMHDVHDAWTDASLHPGRCAPWLPRLPLDNHPQRFRQRASPHRCSPSPRWQRLRLRLALASGW